MPRQPPAYQRPATPVLTDAERAALEWFGCARSDGVGAFFLGEGMAHHLAALGLVRVDGERAFVTEAEARLLGPRKDKP